MARGAQSFQDLVVWRKAHEFVLEVYKVTATFPDHERFGLISQLRRAAVSVPANIAEGFKKRTIPDKLRFYNISQGSLEECRYYTILFKDLGYADNLKVQSFLEDTSRLLNKYINTISRN